MITIEQVKSDILSGKSKFIFYSTSGLWWTHLNEELEAATIIGKRVSEQNHEAMMNDPAVSEENKSKLKSLKAMADKALYTIPMNIEGGPLFQTDEPMKWIDSAIANPDHFGKHQLRAFIKTHHQNCDEIVFKNFDEVNTYLNRYDLIPKKEA